MASEGGTPRFSKIPAVEPEWSDASSPRISRRLLISMAMAWMSEFGLGRTCVGRPGGQQALDAGVQASDGGVSPRERCSSSRLNRVLRCIRKDPVGVPPALSFSGRTMAPETRSQTSGSTRVLSSDAKLRRSAWRGRF